MLTCKACGSVMFPANGRWLCALRLANPQMHRDLTMGLGERFLDRRQGIDNNHRNFQDEEIEQ